MPIGSAIVAETDTPPQENHDTDVLVSVRDLKKHFPIMAGIFRRQVGAVKAVDGVTFDIRRGETLVLTRYVPTREGALVRATPALSSDLVPGTPLAQRWHLAAPTVAGTYDLEVSFKAYGSDSAPAPWVTLISGLRVTRQ